MDILLTGATGFVGRTLLQTLIAETRAYIRVVHRTFSERPVVEEHPRVSICYVENITGDTLWADHLKGCAAVIHTAARVHVMKEQEKNPEAAYTASNVEGTLRLARQAAEAGVKRFIFVSSIKVNGEEKPYGTCYSPDDVENPQGAYACSKYEAERGLFALSQKTGMEVVVIRPPLVYGPGVKGNFKEMIKYLKRGTPLPFAGINNQRSFVSVYNLSSLIVTCLDHPAAANQIFLVSDGADISTTVLLSKMGGALGRPVRLVRLPTWLIRKGLKLLGKKDISQRLLGSLVLDITKTRELLGWEPKNHMDEVLKEIIVKED